MGPKQPEGTAQERQCTVCVIIDFEVMYSHGVNLFDDGVHIVNMIRDVLIVCSCHMIQGAHIRECGPHACHLVEGNQHIPDLGSRLILMNMVKLRRCNVR